jgi:hypothetical protein
MQTSDSDRGAIFAAAKAHFDAEARLMEPDGDLDALYTRQRDLKGAIAGAQDARTKAEKGLARSHLPKTVEHFNRSVENATESISLWQRELELVEVRLAEVRADRAAARREVMDAFTAEVLSDFGKVEFTEDGERPVAVRFRNTGPLADGNTYGIRARGDLSFEVGLVDVARDARRFFVFGFDVDVYAPRHGWSRDGDSATPAQVNWGGHGADSVENVRIFANLLTLAANVAATVNEAFGL